MWHSGELEAHLASRPAMRSHLDHVLVATLVKGLMKQREAAHHMGGGRRSWAARASESEPPQRSGRAESRKPQRLKMSVSELHLEEPLSHTLLAEPRPTPRPRLSERSK